MIVQIDFHHTHSTARANRHSTPALCLQESSTRPMKKAAVEVSTEVKRTQTCGHGVVCSL